MTDRTVGFGKTHATVALGLAAAADGDNVILSAQNINGDYVYNERLLAMSTANVTLKTDTVGQKATLYQTQLTPDSGVIVSVAGCTIEDIIFSQAARGIDSTRTSGLLTINRCIFIGCSRGAVVCVGSGGDTVVNNCIAMFCQNGFVFVDDDTVVVNYCLAAFTSLEGFRRDAGVGTATSNNCVSYNDFLDWTDTWLGATNASTKSSVASGAPASGAIFDITKDNTHFAYYDQPPGATLFPFWDLRTIDGRASVLENVGTPIVGVTDDIDARVRDLTSPNIGPTEGFFGFGGETPCGGSKVVLALL